MKDLSNRPVSRLEAAVPRMRTKSAAVRRFSRTFDRKYKTNNTYSRVEGQLSADNCYRLPLGSSGLILSTVSFIWRAGCFTVSATKDVSMLYIGSHRALNCHFYTTERKSYTLCVCVCDICYLRRHI